MQEKMRSTIQDVQPLLPLFVVAMIGTAMHLAAAEAYMVQVEDLLIKTPEGVAEHLGHLDCLMHSLIGASRDVMVVQHHMDALRGSMLLLCDASMQAVVGACQAKFEFMYQLPRHFDASDTGGDREGVPSAAGWAAVSGCLDAPGIAHSSNIQQDGSFSTRSPFIKISDNMVLKILFTGHLENSQESSEPRVCWSSLSSVHASARGFMSTMRACEEWRVAREVVGVVKRHLCILCGISSSAAESLSPARIVEVRCRMITRVRCSRCLSTPTWRFAGI